MNYKVTVWHWIFFQILIKSSNKRHKLLLECFGHFPKISNKDVCAGFCFLEESISHEVKRKLSHHGTSTLSTWNVIGGIMWKQLEPSFLCCSTPMARWRHLWNCGVVRCKFLQMLHHFLYFRAIHLPFGSLSLLFWNLTSSKGYQQTTHPLGESNFFALAPLHFALVTDERTQDISNPACPVVKSVSRLFLLSHS